MSLYTLLFVSLLGLQWSLHNISYSFILSSLILNKSNIQELNVSDTLSILNSVNTDEVRVLVNNITQHFSNISGLIDEQLGDFGM